MANGFQGIAGLLVPLKDTFPPQSLTVTGAGNGIDVSKVGTNRITARLSCGDATALTSLDVKMQASNDDVTYADISGATFTQVTAGSGVPEAIDFQLPEATSSTAAAYKYVRAYATLVGTSIRMAVSLLANHKYDGQNAYQAAPPTIN